MPFLFLGVGLLAGFILLAWWFSRANPQQVAQGIKVAGVTLLIVLGLFFLFIGRAQLLSLLPFLLFGGMALWPVLKRALRNHPRGASGNQASRVRTQFLEMELDHGTGDVSGTVLEGEFAGRRLDSLNPEELIVLWHEVKGDPQSLQLLEAFIDRVDPDWRAESGAERESGGRTAGGGTMSRAEALEVLGLEEGASQEEIRQAYRKLMQRYHPDSGGSDWFAAKLNAAKDTLLR